MEHTPPDPALVMPMHFEDGSNHLEIPVSIPTLNYETPRRVVDTDIGDVALSGSEASVKPVPIAYLPEAIRRADALRHAS
ncbi:MAG: hypothetical protein ACXWLH_01655 [Candidatus Saccharimonadales bacterium]